MTFLFWFAVTFGTIYAVWQLYLIGVLDEQERFKDVDRLAKASRATTREDAGAGTGTSPRLATRPGIRGPLSNGRRNR
jgi:hypothetical protein